MRSWQSPFYWVEKGPFSRPASRSVWVAYAITAIICFAQGLKSRRGFSFLEEDEFWILIAIEGLLVLAVSAAFYGTSIFAREKERLRAPALLLTGASPWRVMRAKIVATYAAQALSMIVVGAVLLVASLEIRGQRFSDDELMGVSILWQAWLFGPLLGVVVGMAFSLAARSITRAALGFLSSILWGVGLAFCIGVFMDVAGFRNPELLFVPIAVANIGLIVFNRRWGPLRLGLLLALNFYFLIFALIACDDAVRGSEEAFWMSLIGCGIAYLVILGWGTMVLRFFDAGLAGRPVSLGREKWIR